MSEEKVEVPKSELIKILERLDGLEELIRRGGRPIASYPESP
jgi:hypothetical protein